MQKIESPILKAEKSRKTIFAAALILFPLAFGILSLLLGRDMNWDLRNYHYYNAYAFVEQRMDFDIAPSQLQTYINPLLDLPFYWLVRKFPAWVAGFVLGMLHGLNPAFIFLIFWKMSNQENWRDRVIWGTCIALISAIAPTFLAELGNTMNENLTSAFVLGTILLLILAIEQMERGRSKAALRFIGLGGLIMGLGVGLKPSIAAFAIALVPVISLFRPSLLHPLKRFTVYGLSGVIGGLISSGFWWLEMWKRFGNPFFPFYNHIFKSPDFSTLKINWSAYFPHNVWETIFWPFVFTFNSLQGNQISYFDLRFVLLYSLVLIWLGLMIFRYFHILPPVSREDKSLIDLGLGNFLLFFFLISYLLWLKESGTYRFLAPLELLVPMCFIILADRLVPSRKALTNLAVLAAIATLIFFKPFNWIRLEWTDHYFEVDTARVVETPDPLVLMLGTAPISYVIPEFPANFRFVRAEGNLFSEETDSGRSIYGYSTSHSFFVRIKNMLALRDKPFYILYARNDPYAQPEKSLLRLGITTKPGQCFQLQVNTPDMLIMCQVLK